ncbi:MAG: ABC transporter ATP-binding protein [Bryobacteraceae bacterium]
MNHAISSRELTKVFRVGAGDFKALDALTFDISPGEIVGIIGRNGAGKSTLLKILARILAPTSGRVELRGRVGSLLEVGTGFHSELTGRENIHLSAALLGISESDLARRLDSIVDFSGVEAFIDTPVKRYSSGMYMRLAFAVAAHLEPEILLVDEVLAVGDLEFQKKCVQRIDSLGQNGQTVLFVSHNMQAVARLCQRGIWLDGGRIVRDGPMAEVTAAYVRHGAVYPGVREWPDVATAPGDRVVRLRKVLVRGPDGEPTASVNIGDPFDIEIDYEVLTGGVALFPALRIFNEWGGEVIWSTDSPAPGHGKPREPGRYHCAVHFPANLLAEGFLNVVVTIMSLQPKKFHLNEADCVHLQATEVIDGSTARGAFSDTVSSLIRPRLEWTVSKVETADKEENLAVRGIR